MNTSRQPQLLRAVLTKPRYRVDFSCPILDDFIRFSFTKLTFVRVSVARGVISENTWSLIGS